MVTKTHSLAYEAFVSFLKGCSLSISTGLTLLLIYSLFDFKIIQNPSYFLQNADAWDPWLAEITRNWRIALFAVFMFYVVGTLQFVLIVLPFAIFISKGLGADPNRGWFFYVASGTLLGSFPWIIIYMIFGNYTLGAIFDNLLWLYPGLTTGPFAGIFLDRRLAKLAAATGIESDIK